MSCVTCHVSRVTCHVSHVTDHFIYFFFFGQSGEAYRLRVCYQRGLPRLVILNKLNQLEINLVLDFSFYVLGWSLSHMFMYWSVYLFLSFPSSLLFMLIFWSSNNDHISNIIYTLDCFACKNFIHQPTFTHTLPKGCPIQTIQPGGWWPDPWKNADAQNIPWDRKGIKIIIVLEILLLGDTSLAQFLLAAIGSHRKIYIWSIPSLEYEFACHQDIEEFCITQ